MTMIYRHDPDDVQSQLSAALRAADTWQSTASCLLLALHGLRAAVDACPSEGTRAVLRRQGEQLQEQHQEALCTARACAEAVTELTAQLARVADADLARAA